MHWLLRDTGKIVRQPCNLIKLNSSLYFMLTFYGKKWNCFIIFYVRVVAFNGLKTNISLIIPRDSVLNMKLFPLMHRHVLEAVGLVPIQKEADSRCLSDKRGNCGEYKSRHYYYI